MATEGHPYNYAGRIIVGAALRGRPHAFAILMRRRIATICYLLLIAPLTAFAQNQSVALLTAECQSIRDTCHVQHLVRYRFRNGVMVSRDVILSGPTDGVRYDLGQNHIYRNRYVITNWGDIVDVPNKKLLHEGEGEYVATEGDRIIHEVNTIKTNGHFYYDLKTRQYGRIHGPTKWALPGLLSRYWAGEWSATATDGYVAFLYGDVGSNLGYPKGVKVWSSANGEWTTIDDKWVTQIIGWIRE